MHLRIMLDVLVAAGANAGRCPRPSGCDPVDPGGLRGAVRCLG